MILVTGAPGNVGTELVRLLGEGGEAVRVLIRKPESAVKLHGQAVETVVGDLADRDSLAPALAGADRVFLSSAVGPAIIAQKNLIEMAGQAGVRHIVKLSWLGASEHVHSVPFGRWHAEAENALKSSGVAYTVLRASAFMQNYLHVIVTPDANIVYGASGEGRVGFVDARDVAAVAARVLAGGHEGRIYEVTGPVALTSAELAAIVSKVTGRPVHAVDVSPDQLADNYRRLGWPDPWAEELAAIQKLRSEGRLEAVTDVVESITGRRPTSFEEFVREFASA